MSPEKMRAAVIRNLKDRTGKSLEEWVRLSRRIRAADMKELRRRLKEDHGLGGTTTMIIAEAALGDPGRKPDDTSVLAAQFEGEKAALRPAYDRLVREVKKLGADVRIGVRKTQTTFARGHTFAIARAPTRTRIDLGLRLPGVKPTRRLQATTAFSDNASHCVKLTGAGDIDGQLVRWLKAAYEARG